MNNKIQKVKILTRQFLKIAVLGIVAIVVISTLRYFISTQLEEVQKSNKTLQREINSIKKEKANFSKKLGLANDYIAEYEKVKSDYESNKMSLNRNLVRNKLNQLKSKHRIAELQVNISPARNVNEEQLKKKNVDVLISPVNINIRAFTDIDIYNFMYDMKKEMPGFVIFKDFNINRNSDLGKSELISISRGGKPVIVTADFSLDWVGIKND